MCGIVAATKRAGVACTLAFGLEEGEIRSFERIESAVRWELAPARNWQLRRETVSAEDLPFGTKILDRNCDLDHYSGRSIPYQPLLQFGHYEAQAQCS